jgi:two-component system KDP operon response regulator KdpE
MLTAIRDDDAVVRALDMGAVDFVNKPFSPKVLLARARAALRLPASVPEPPAETTGYEDGYLVVDTDARRVYVKATRLSLTKTEYELLTYLVANRGQVLTFEQILDQVWGAGYSRSTDYVHVYVSRLRRKIEEDPRQPRYLLTERGVGYRFEKTEQS